MLIKKIPYILDNIQVYTPSKRRINHDVLFMIEKKIFDEYNRLETTSRTSKLAYNQINRTPIQSRQKTQDVTSQVQIR